MIYLVNFVYEEMSEKNKNETKENSILSTYFIEKYGEKSNIGCLNEENYIDEITKYMTNDSNLKMI